MERAFLEEFGLEKEQINKILDQASRDIGAKVSEINALQSKYDQKVDELKSANTTIDNLKKANTDNESLLKEIDTYKAKVKEQEAQFKQSLIKNTAILELQKKGAINPELAVHLVDLSLGNVDKDGTVLGIAEQIERIAADETQSYLFGTAKANESVQAEPEQPQSPYDRGGYTPQTGEQPSFGKTQGYGKAAGTAMAEGGGAMSTDDFWANFGTI